MNTITNTLLTLFIIAMFGFIITEIPDAIDKELTHRELVNQERCKQGFTAHCTRHANAGGHHD